MAFTGSETVTAQGKDVVRITGLSLASTAAGTITASGGAGDVTLPATFPALDAQATWCIVNQAGAPSAGTPLVSVAKDSGPFATITLTNEDGANDTGALEIYVINLFSRA